MIAPRFALEATKSCRRSDGEPPLFETSDQLLLLGHERVDLGRLTGQVVGDRVLIVQGREWNMNSSEVLPRHTLPCCPGLEEFDLVTHET